MASLTCCVFLLLSWAILPKEASNRHFLSVGLITAVISLQVCGSGLICVSHPNQQTSSNLSLQLAFVIPLGTDPEICYNGITPHDMHSNFLCAWTGALFQLGGMATTFWGMLDASVVGSGH